MIKQLIMAAAMAIISMSALAGYVQTPIEAAGWSKLTPAQQAEFQKQVALAAEAAASSPTFDVKKVDEYVVVGEHIGKMLGGAAKEIGVAVNTFSDTPVGKWTMAMIIWKFMGNAVMHIFGAAMILIFGFTFLMILLRRSYPLNVTYRPEFFWGVFNRRIAVERKPMGDTDIWFFSIGGAIVVGAAMIVLFTGS